MTNIQGEFFENCTNRGDEELRLISMALAMKPSLSYGPLFELQRKYLYPLSLVLYRHEEFAVSLLDKSIVAVTKTLSVGNTRIGELHFTFSFTLFTKGKVRTSI